MATVPRSVYAAAVAAGIAYANLAVALPLYALAHGGTASLAGALLAVNTIAFSLGAVLAGPLGRPRTVLAAGLAAVAAGDLVLLASGSTAGLVAGSLVHGTGMGLFWVGTQSLLGSRSGRLGSERVFVRQYALYIAGTATGSALTGSAIGLLRLLGVGHSLSIRLTFSFGLAAALGVLAGWAPARLARLRLPAPGRRLPLVPTRGLRLQLPDFFLVSAMALLLNLAPVVLEGSFGFSPVAIGVVVGAIAAAKIAGSLTAGRVTRAAGSRRAVVGMLAGSTAFAILLTGTHAAPLFVALLLATALLGIGAWPVIVDAGLARVPLERRTELAVAWNVREYVVIAIATAGGGRLLDAFGSPTVLIALVAALLAGSAASAAVVLRPAQVALGAEA